jgi:PhnB protein
MPSGKSESNATQLPASRPLAPHLTIAGARAAIAFYERAFGARAGYVQETPDGRVLHGDVHLPNGGVFFLCDDFPEMGGSRAPKGTSPVTIHLELPDVDAVWKQAVAAGAKVAMELADQFWGARYGVLSDPFGHRWSLATQREQLSRGELDQAAKSFGASGK